MMMERLLKRGGRGEGRRLRGEDGVVEGKKE